MLNLATVLDYSAKENPQKTAIIFGETQIPYGRLNAASNQIANGLVKAGRRGSGFRQK